MELVVSTPPVVGSWSLVVALVRCQPETKTRKHSVWSENVPSSPNLDARRQSSEQQRRAASSSVACVWPCTASRLRVRLRATSVCEESWDHWRIPICIAFGNEVTYHRNRSVVVSGSHAGGKRVYNNLYQENNTYKENEREALSCG